MNADRRLVLIHGFTERPSMWQPLLERMNDASLAVSTPSIPGHGDHPHIPVEWTAASYCNAIINQIPNDGLPWIVVGHSMGGYLASTLVTMVPERIAALGFFHSKAGADSPQKIEDRKRAIHAASQNKNLYLATMLRNTLSDKNREAYGAELSKLIAEAQEDIGIRCIEAAQSVMIERPDNVAFLSGVNYPIYYFLGKDDQSIPVNQMNEELRALSQAHVTIVDNTGHMGQLEACLEALHWLRLVAAT